MYFQFDDKYRLKIVLLVSQMTKKQLFDSSTMIFALTNALLVAVSLAQVVDVSQQTAGNVENFKSDGIILKRSNETVTSYGWTEYKQCDSRWANQQLGTCSGTTICSAGCAMTSVAMILHTKGSGKDPSSLNSWLKSNGGYASGCNIVWGSVDALGYTKFQGKEKASESAICDGLAKGHGIVANVHGGSHWVLLTACKGNGVYYVNDPGYSTTTYKHSDILEEAVYH